MKKAILLILLLITSHAYGEEVREPLEVKEARTVKSWVEMDETIRRADGYFQNEGYVQAHELYKALLSNPAFAPKLPWRYAEEIKQFKKKQKAELEDKKKEIKKDKKMKDELSRFEKSQKFKLGKHKKKYDRKRLEIQAKREKVTFYMTRCIFEIAKNKRDSVKLTQATEKFMQLGSNLMARNVRRYENPKYNIEAKFWAGRGFYPEYSMHAQVPDYFSSIHRLRKKKIQPVDAAICLFRSVMHSNPKGELEADAGRYLSMALTKRAKSIETIKDHDEYMDSLKKKLSDEDQEKLDREEELRKKQKAEAEKKLSAAEKIKLKREKKRQDKKKVFTLTNKLYHEAIRELVRITTHYPTYIHRKEIELLLINLRMDLGQYADAKKLANMFVAREPERTAHRARAAWFRARCVYFLGDIESAMEMYEDILVNERPEEDTQINALYGVGWCAIRLASIAGNEQRTIYLNLALKKFTHSEQKMSLTDQRRKSAIAQIAKVLLEQKRYADALVQLKKILTDSEMSVQANYLAGNAARGLAANYTSNVSEYNQAVTHYEYVLQNAEGDERSKYLLETLRSLADLEIERGGYAEALEYFSRTAEVAKFQFKHTYAAEASFGKAKALIGVGDFNGNRLATSINRSAEAFMMMFASSDGNDPEDMATAAENLAFRLRASKNWKMSVQTDDGVARDNYTSALKIISFLRKRLGARLRKDELDYYEARALFLRTQQQRNNSELDVRSSKQKYKGILEGYHKAGAMYKVAANANPRGMLSSKINLDMGKALVEGGRYAFEIADMLRMRGDENSASPYQEEGKMMLMRAIPAFKFVVRASQNIALKAEARNEMGNAYFDLEEYDRALAEFQNLSGDQDIGHERRVAATLRWALALSKLGNTDEAISKLLPYIGTDLISAIEVSKMQVEMGRRKKAYLILKEILKTNLSITARKLVAEARYRAYNLALLHSKEVYEGMANSDSERNVAIQQMIDTVRIFGDTEWSSKGVETLGKHYLDRGEWKEALEVVAAVQKDVDAHKDALQAVYLLKGRAYVMGKKYDKARAAYIKAESVVTDTEQGRLHRAIAIREQGDVLSKQDKEREALMLYGRVYAIYYNQKLQADLARISAAEIHAKLGSYEVAMKILKLGSDQALIRPHRQKIEKKYRKSGN